VRLSVDQIVAQVQAQHIVITGGEPILFNLDPLIDGLQQRFPLCTIQIETSGVCDFKGELRPGWITWSPKENLNWDAPEDFRMQVNEIKWVVDEGLTMERLWEAWARNVLLATSIGRDPAEFVLMPEGSPPTQESCQRAMDMLARVPHQAAEYWRFGGRMQYWIGVR
jgi:organic radical activating enzyme